MTDIEIPDPLGRAPGEPLDPLRHSADALTPIERVMGPRLWPAMWQQTPRKAGGNRVSRVQVEILEVPPPGMAWQRGWDVAYTGKQTAKADPDYSAGVLGGIWQYAPGDIRVVIRHLDVFRADWPGVKARIARVAQSDGPGVGIGVGMGGAKPAIADLLTLPDLLGYHVAGVPEVGDKVSRAQPWIDRWVAGWFCVVAGPWTDAFFDWLEAFPFGAHDDVPDALSVLWWLLTTQPDDAVSTEYLDVSRISLSDWDRYA